MLNNEKDNQLLVENYLTEKKIEQKVDWERYRQFKLPSHSIKTLLSAKDVHLFRLLFALYFTYWKTNKRKTQLVNAIKITDIARLTGQNMNADARESIKYAIKHLNDEGLINYFWLPSRCLKDLKLTEPFKVIKSRFSDLEAEVEQNNHHAAIVFELTKPPCLREQKEKSNELDGIIEIPSNFCHIIREIIQKTKATRNSLSLHRLALWLATNKTLPQGRGRIEKLNKIIGFSSDYKKGKKYNKQMLSKLLNAILDSPLLNNH